MRNPEGQMGSGGTGWDSSSKDRKGARKRQITQSENDTGMF